MAASLVLETLVPAGAARPQRAGAAMGRWKRQVAWFASGLALLFVLVVAASAAAMWLVQREVERGELLASQRGDAALAVRLAVLEVDRHLGQAIAAGSAEGARAAAVASIAAASRLEDAVTGLKGAIEHSRDVQEMARLIEAVREPRVQVIVLARRGDQAQARMALEAIGPRLQEIDALSASLLQQQAAQRRQAAQERGQMLEATMGTLVTMAAVMLLLGWVMYRRLMQRFDRSDQLEQLLQQVAHSAGELEAGGEQLQHLHGQVRHTNGRLGDLLDALRQASEAMTREARSCLDELAVLGKDCETSADDTRRHVKEAAVVVDQIRSTTQRMQQLLASAGALARSRDDIATLSDQIAGISATTRLLSLNAAVEAARAGAAGRGFGVIAASVRQLAEDTREAATAIRRASDDITAQLAATTGAARDTGELMDDCARRVDGLDTSARSNQALVERIARGMQGFRGSFQRQVQQIEGVDGDAQALADVLAAGHGHGALLEASAQSLAATSANLTRRLSGLQQ